MNRDDRWTKVLNGLLLAFVLGGMVADAGAKLAAHKPPPPRPERRLRKIYYVKADLSRPGLRG